MKKVYLVLAFILIFTPSFLAAQDDCDCAYPIIFVHGWAGGETSWFDFASEIYPDESIIIPDMQSANPAGTVYYANLNFKYGQTNISGPDDGLNSYSLDIGSEYIDDDVIVHEQFINKPEILPGRCLYAISFQTKKDLVFSANQPVLVTESSLTWNSPTTELPNGESASNQASVYKQGYALGRAIASIREATGKDKVILVGHSMGGLASREYLQRSLDGGLSHLWWIHPTMTDGHKIAKLFTVGTPHRGSNQGSFQDIFDFATLSELGIDYSIRSEAVRDLRLYYTDFEADFSNLLSFPSPGISLYGGNESDLQSLVFDNIDVNCNGEEISNNVIGLNSDGFPNDWNGTEDNSQMRLPTNLRYTYYVSDSHNIIQLHVLDKLIGLAKPDWADALCSIREILVDEGIIEPSELLYEASDGIVAAKSQWLFYGGNGSSADFLSGSSIPVPEKSGAPSYSISDRITTPSGSAHISALGYAYSGDASGFICDGLSGLITSIVLDDEPAIGETQDYDILVKGIDEPDFPYFAYEIQPNIQYSGIAQIRADIVASGSNPPMNGSAAGRMIDADWYVFETVGDLSSFTITVEHNSDFDTRVDFYTASPGDFSNPNATESLSQFRSEGDDNPIQFSTCEAQNTIGAAVYYLRITHDLGSNSGAAVSAWRDPYKFRVTTNALSVEDIALDCSAGVDDAVLSYRLNSTSLGANQLANFGVTISNAENGQVLDQGDLDSGINTFSGDLTGITELLIAVTDYSTGCTITETVTISPDCNPVISEGCGVINDVYSLSYPFGENNFTIGCASGCGAHQNGDFHAQDWNLGGGNDDCDLPFYSPLSGTVWFAGATTSPVSYGNQVVIQSDQFPGVAFKITHLNSIDVALGDPVQPGTQLGTVGNSGSGLDPNIGEFTCHAHMVLHDNLDNTAWNTLSNGGFLTSTNYAAQFTLNCDECPVTSITNTNLNCAGNMITIQVSGEPGTPFSAQEINNGFNNPGPGTSGIIGASGVTVVTVGYNVDNSNFTTIQVSTTGCAKSIVINRSTCDSSPCTIQIFDFSLTCLAEGGYEASITFEGDGGLYNIFDNDNSTCNGAGGISGCNFPDMPAGTYTFGPITADNPDYTITIEDDDNPICSVNQPIPAVEASCTFSCIESNCINYDVSCNGDDTYSADISFIGDNSVAYTLETFFPSSADPYQLPIAVFPNQNGINIISNIPIGQDVVAVVRESNVAICSGDSRLIKYFPELEPSVIPDCINNSFSVEVCIDEFAALTTYTLNDGLTNTTIDGGSCVTLGSYASGTNITVTLSDATNSSCNTTATTTYDCGNPNTCDDGIMNNGELGVDCGGSCPPCVDCTPSFSSCPGTIASGTDSGENFATVTYTLPVVDAPCDPGATPTLLSGMAQGSQFPIGITEIVYEYGGVECRFNVVVSDNEPPQLDCAGSQIVFTEPSGCFGVVPDLTNLIEVEDNSGDVTVFQFPGPGALFGGIDGYQLTVTIIATDEDGNSSECDITLTLRDNESPEFVNCPVTPYVFGSDPDLCSVYANWSIPVATDNCNVTIAHVSGPEPGGQLAAGQIYTVVYQASDGVNTPVSCVFDVQVNETQNPELNCPQNVFVSSDPGVCEAAVDNLQLEFAFDNCPYTVTWTSSPTDVSSTGTSTSDNASGAIFPVGITTVIYTITEDDDFGNGTVVATCDLIVTVTDTEAPEITCPTSVVIGTNDDAAGNYDCATDYQWTHPTPTDNCAVIIYTITYTNPDGSTEGPTDLLGQGDAVITRNFDLGATSILYHVEDAEGNITECTWTVDVIDDEDPMIFCEEVVVTNVYPFKGQLDLWPEDVVTATILVVPSMAITDLNIPLLAGNQGDMGNLSVTLTSPAGTTVNLFDGLCAGTADFNMSLDDAAATSITTATCAPLGGGMSYVSTEALGIFNGENSAGEWVLTFTNASVDVCGYLTDWQLEIIGNDVGADANRLQALADMGTCTYTMSETTFDPPFTDNCPDAFITHNYEFGPFDHTLEGSVFELGETTVVWTVTDATGNAVSCTLIVEILDTEAPQFTNCPRPDIILNPLPGTCEAFTNFSLPLATDNCGNPTIFQTDLTGLITGEMFPVGTTILTFEASDAAGNTDHCELRIIVNDSHAVLAEGNGCPNDVDVNTDPGGCGAVINNIAPAFTDSNCPDNLSIIYRIDEVGGEEWANGFTDISGTFFPAGSHIAQYRAQDQALLLITEITHDIQQPLGGNDIIPPYMTVRALPDEDFLEIANFGPASLDIGGLDIERIHAAGRDTFRVPALEILAPGEVFVLHFGHDYDSPADHYYNVHCANNLAATDGAAYILSHSGRVLDVAAINGFDPVGAGVAGVPTAIDWSGTISDNLAGIRRISVWDDNEAGDFVSATVCGEITIGQFNPDLTFAADNGSLTSLQARLPNKLECSFAVSITDNELPVCGSYEPYENYLFDTETIINAGDCFEATVSVPSDYLLADVNTQIQGSTGDFANLTFTLISPEGEELVLADGICAGSNGWDVTLDSDSTSVAFVQDACVLLNSGTTLRPSKDLNLFNKRPVQGIWTLQIAHNATENNDPVTFSSWELRVSELISYQQGDTTIENDFRVCGADFTWLHTGIWDNCPGGELTITYTFEDGTIQGTAPITRQEYGLPITRFFDVGVTTVTYDMTDSNGNTSSCAFDLTVLDTEPPQLSCPMDITIQLPGRECDVIYRPLDWYTMDNCMVVDTVVSPPWELPLPIGINEVTLQVIDQAGNVTSCVYTVTVLEFVPDQPDMACIQELNVSLGPDCQAEITANMVLTGDNYHCIEDYEVTLYEGPNPDDPLIPTSPFVTEAYAGQTIVYSVYDPDFDITCWGYIHVELYDEPDFECPADIAVNCLSDTDPVITGEPVLLSCALGGATVTHEDVVQEFGACDDPRVLITRTWTVADGFGNSTSCVQTITIVAFDVADIVFPPDYNNVVLPALNCADVLNDPSLTHPDSTGYPTLNGTTDVFLPNYCNASYFYEDQTFNTCPGSYEIVRIWQVRNTCLPYELGVNPRVHTQIIQVFDTDGPQVVCPSNETISTGPFDCTATYRIPDPGVEDACSATTYSVTTNDGVLSVIGSTYFLSNLPMGPTTIEYRVVDECVGVSECSYTVTVEDLIEPTAACDDELNVSLGGGDIANGIEGEARIFATDVDEGSNDNCGEVTLEVRRNFWRDGMCDPSESRWSPWAEYVDFYCCDINNEITIELRVTDESDNENICWLVITPEDKLNPFCYSPEDVDLTCNDLPLAFPGDIETAYEEDFAATSLMMDALFGAASGTDNCAVDTIVERTPSLNLNECGWGTITRRFEAWQIRPEGDTNGNDVIDIDEAYRSTNSCSQLITITEIHDFVIDFPEDIDADCSDPDVPTIITEAMACDVLSVNISEPLRFAATGDECYKLNIIYDVINWCLWDGEYTGYVISRMTEDDGEDLAVDRAVEGNERPVVHFDENGLCVDRRHNDRDGDSSLTNCESPELPNYGRYIYAQFIKVYDTTVPVVTVSDFGGPTELCPDLEPGQYGDALGVCEADVSIPFSVSDDCELFDGAGDLVVSIILAEVDEFAVDANGDGDIKSNEFVSDGSIIGDITDNGDGTFVFNGVFPIITSAMGPNVVHAIRVLFEDGCGNQTSEYIEFDVIDCKGPAPICINGLTVTLMPQTEGDCAMSIWAIDFEGSPIYDCTGQGPEIHPVTSIPRVTKHAIYRQSTVEAAGDSFVPSPTQTGIVLTEADDATTIVYVYAFDEEGNYDYCETYVQVQLHQSCNELSSGGISGTIMTEGSEAVENVEISLNGDESMTMTTINDGYYSFTNLAAGGDYTVTPYLNTDPLNGVSTFDIILISKHILGIQPLDSPYKRIAADVNRSNSITTLDLIRIRKLILNINTEFSDNTSWRFVEAAYTFPDIVNPWFEEFPEVINENNLTVSISNADFVGVKVGDVNGSAQANLFSGDDRTLQGLFNFQLENIELLAGNEYTVAFTHNQLIDWEGYQATIEWHNVELLGIEYGLAEAGNFGFHQLEQGVVTTSWDQTNSRATDNLLFSCRIKANTNQPLSEAIGISDRYTLSEAYKRNSLIEAPAAVGVVFDDQAVNLRSTFDLYQNVPNPFTEKTLLGFYLPESGKTSLTIRDVSGKILYTFEKELSAGYHRLSITQMQLQNVTGVLSYTLRSGKYLATRKMVLLDN